MLHALFVGLLMLFRLRPEDFSSSEQSGMSPLPVPRPASESRSTSMSDLSPDEWRVVHMMLADHRRFGEVLAQGTGTAAKHAHYMAANVKRRR